MRRRNVLLAFAVFGMFLAALPLALPKSSTRPPAAKTYDKAVNETLDMVLQVGGEWRGQRKKFTWQELELEAAKRLNVERTEPWNR